MRDRTVIEADHWTVLDPADYEGMLAVGCTRDLGWCQRIFGFRDNVFWEFQYGLSLGKWRHVPWHKVPDGARQALYGVARA